MHLLLMFWYLNAVRLTHIRAPAVSITTTSHRVILTQDNICLEIRISKMLSRPGVQRDYPEDENDILLW